MMKFLFLSFAFLFSLHVDLLRAQHRNPAFSVTEIQNVDEVDITSTALIGLIDNREDATVDYHSLSDVSTYQDEGTYSVKVRFTNQTSNVHWIVQLPFQTITHGHLLLKSLDGQDSLYRELGIFQRRSESSGSFSLGRKCTYVDAYLRSGAIYELTLVIKNEKDFDSINPYIHLVPGEDFIKDQSSAVMIYGLFSGVVIVILAIVLIFYSTTRETLYLQYAGYIFTFLLWSAFSSGLLREWCYDVLNFQDPRYYYFLRSMGIPSTFFYVRFLIEFSGLHEKYAGLRTIRKWVMPVMVGMVLLDWISLLATDFNFIYSNFISLVVVLFFVGYNIVMLGLILRHKEVRYRWLMITAITIFLLGLTAIIIKIVYNEFRSIYAWEAHLATLFEMGIFSFGIGLRARDHVKTSKENDVIKGLLGEKETLLKEVHHRVKNNLQVVSSLLGMQSLSIQDEHAKSAIQEGRSRVHSMSLIHQYLYKDDQLTGVPMPKYIRRLCEDLIRTYEIGDTEIILYDDVDEDLVLDVETVVPIGLVINELMTNSLKHAFVDKAKGLITVMLHEVNNELMLEVKDNGIGLDATKASSDSFGLRLVKSFNQKLDGELVIKSDNGTHIILTIKKYKKLS